jgi:hypothetical protein
MDGIPGRLRSLAGDRLATERLGLHVLHDGRQEFISFEALSGVEIETLAYEACLNRRTAHLSLSFGLG